MKSISVICVICGRKTSVYSVSSVRDKKRAKRVTQSRRDDRTKPGVLTPGKIVNRDSSPIGAQEKNVEAVLL